MDMMKVPSEDLECVKMRAIGWTLLVLATVVAEIKTSDLLQR